MSKITAVVVDMGAPESECNAVLQYSYISLYRSSPTSGVQGQSAPRTLPVKTTPALSFHGVQVWPKQYSPNYEPNKEFELNHIELWLQHKNILSSEISSYGKETHTVDQAFLFSQDGWKEVERADREEGGTCGTGLWGCFWGHLCCILSAGAMPTTLKDEWTATNWVLKQRENRQVAERHKVEFVPAPQTENSVNDV